MKNNKQMSVGRKIYENIIVSDRAYNKLKEDPHFGIIDLSDKTSRLIYLSWSLFWGQTDGDGRFEIVRGPHFIQSYIELSDVTKSTLLKLFNLDGILICVTMSRDLHFSSSRKYILDYNKEFFLYDFEVSEISTRIMSAG